MPVLPRHVLEGQTEPTCAPPLYTCGPPEWACATSGVEFLVCFWSKNDAKTHDRHPYFRSWSARIRDPRCNFAPESADLVPISCRGVSFCMTPVAILYAINYEFCNITCNFVTRSAIDFMTKSVKLHPPVMKVKKKVKKNGIVCMSPCHDS